MRLANAGDRGGRTRCRWLPTAVLPCRYALASRGIEGRDPRGQTVVCRGVPPARPTAATGPVKGEVAAESDRAHPPLASTSTRRPKHEANQKPRSRRRLLLLRGTTPLSLPFPARPRPRPRPPSPPAPVAHHCHLSGAALLLEFVGTSLLPSLCSHPSSADPGSTPEVPTHFWSLVLGAFSVAPNLAFLGGELRSFQLQI